MNTLFGSVLLFGVIIRTNERTHELTYDNLENETDREYISFSTAAGETDQT